MSIVTAGLLRPQALLPTRGLGRFASAPSPAPTPDTHDGWYIPSDIIDGYRKAKRREYENREQLADDMRSMLEDAVTSSVPDIAKEAAELQRKAISRKGGNIGGRASITPFVDYSLLLADLAALQAILALWLRLKRLEDEAILVLLLDE